MTTEKLASDAREDLLALSAVLDLTTLVYGFGAGIL